jgi:hypothetical protein
METPMSTEPTSPTEPTDLELALWERDANLGWGFAGPLTREQAEAEAAYERYCIEREEEHEAQERAGGRTICPACGNRSVRHSSVCTLGYPGHPGAEFSGYARCETPGCGYADLA